MHETSLLSSSVCGAWMSGVSAAIDICEYVNIPVNHEGISPLLNSCFKGFQKS